jgi:RNA polymerase sigma factor (sigma-70 family)
MRDDDYDEFFRGVIERAVRSAERVLLDHHAAEDAAVEALARAHARWSRLRHDPHREAWVLRVAINVAIDAHRKRQRFHRTVAASPARAFEDHAVDQLSLTRAIGRLPARQRDAISLRYLADLPEQDVATAMAVSVGTVKTHVHRGLRTLGTDLAHQLTYGVSDATA